MFSKPDPGGAAPKPKTPGYNPGAPTVPAVVPGPTVTTPDPVTSTTTPAFPGVSGVLGSDPTYQSLLTMDMAMSGQDKATMNQRIAAMNSYYGSDSDPLSILGRVYQSYQDRNRVIANTLTGHGMINSGETGFQGARATLAYQQQELDARMKLQQYIQGLQDAFQTAERNRQLTEWQASAQAIADWINNPANQPSSQTTQPPDVTTYPAIPASITQAVNIANQKGNEMMGV
jgi:hypothetical protein